MSEWIAALRHDEGSFFHVNANTVICGAHFRQADFLPKTEGSKHRLLRKVAVPSMFAFSSATSSSRPSQLQHCQTAELKHVEKHQLSTLPVLGP